MSNEAKTRLTNQQIKKIVDDVYHPSKSAYDIALEIVRIVEDRHSVSGSGAFAGIGAGEQGRYGFVVGDG